MFLHVLIHFYETFLEQQESRVIQALIPTSNTIREIFYYYSRKFHTARSVIRLGVKGILSIILNQNVRKFLCGVQLFTNNKKLLHS